MTWKQAYAYMGWYRYMPILPLVLTNGAEGIGTGWSTSIPNYNPRDLVSNMKRLLNGEEPVEMQPWYRGFNGSIMEVPSKTAGKSYTLNGVVSQVGAYITNWLQPLLVHDREEVQL